MVKGSDRTLVWVDLEMTGLDPKTCAIIQMAMILTDVELQEVAPPWEMTIWQPDSVLESMSPFVRDMHATTGLLQQVRASKTSLEEAEKKAMQVLTEHVGYGNGILCGNSIGQDRRFLYAYMPTFEGYLHYRQIDVSTVKELAGWWYNEKYPKPDSGQHTALFDIRQSLEELRFYRKQIFKQP